MIYTSNKIKMNAINYWLQLVNLFQSEVIPFRLTIIPVWNIQIILKKWVFHKYLKMRITRILLIHSWLAVLSEIITCRWNHQPFCLSQSCETYASFIAVLIKSNFIIKLKRIRPNTMTTFTDEDAVKTELFFNIKKDIIKSLIMILNQKKTLT